MYYVAYFFTAPGVQWLLDHGTAYEGDFSTEDYFSLTQLQCYPEIALAVQGTGAHTCIGVHLCTARAHNKDCVYAHIIYTHT